MIFVDWAFASAGTRRVLCGWTEYLDGHCDVLVMMVEKESDQGVDYNKQNINNIYIT